MVSALMLTSGQAYDNRYLLNLLLDRDFGLYENIGANTLMCHPQAMKALHYASWEDSRYSKGERTMKVKVKSCC
jgi:hypothetical protein